MKCHEVENNHNHHVRKLAMFSDRLEDVLLISDVASMVLQQASEDLFLSTL